MKLAIFDIDGTLVKSNKADAQCFLDTIKAVIHPEANVYDEERFTHFTDACIAQELFEWHQQRMPNAADIERFKTQYLSALQASLLQNPSGFEAVAGAKTVLHQFPNDWQVALATGCWRESALMKLACAQIDIQNLPIATSSEAFSREGIIETAIRKAKEAAQVTGFEYIVYIGDGIWDVKTCRNMQLPLVGIDAEANSRKRALLGDSFKLEHFEPFEAVLTSLTFAKIPS